MFLKRPKYKHSQPGVRLAHWVFYLISMLLILYLVKEVFQPHKMIDGEKALDYLDSLTKEPSKDDTELSE